MTATAIDLLSPSVDPNKSALGIRRVVTRNVECCCPVMNLFRSAGVQLNVAWEKVGG